MRGRGRSLKWRGLKRHWRNRKKLRRKNRGGRSLACPALGHQPNRLLHHIEGEDRRGESFKRRGWKRDAWSPFLLKKLIGGRVLMAGRPLVAGVEIREGPCSADNPSHVPEI